MENDQIAVLAVVALLLSVLGLGGVAYTYSDSGQQAIGISQRVSTWRIIDDAVTEPKLDYEEVEVTVEAGNTTGTGICTNNSMILGYYPTSNQDQFVDSVAVSGTTVTVTLDASATAGNVFDVVLLKV